MCLQAPSVVFDRGSFTAVAGATNLINANTVSFSGSPSIYVIYSGSSTQEKFTGLPTIHIPSVTFPCNSLYEVKVSGVGFQRTVLFNSRTDRGFGISVRSLGNYNFSYNSKEYSSQGVFTDVHKDAELSTAEENLRIICVFVVAFINR
jgi:hypothetical protein